MIYVLMKCCALINFKEPLMKLDFNMYKKRVRCIIVQYVRNENVCDFNGKILQEYFTVYHAIRII